MHGHLWNSTNGLVASVSPADATMTPAGSVDGRVDLLVLDRVK